MNTETIKSGDFCDCGLCGHKGRVDTTLSCQVCGVKGKLKAVPESECDCDTCNHIKHLFN